MKIEKFKSLGLNQMHPMQVHALMDVINLSIQLASMLDDDNILEEVEDKANDLVQLLGGGGVKVEVSTF